jgi:prolyl oligopeptidase
MFGWTLIFLGALAATPTESLHALFAEEWEARLQEDPWYASTLGDVRYRTQWPDPSPAAFDRRVRRRQSFLQRLESIDPSTLSPDDRLNFELFRRELKLEIDGARFGWHLLPINQREGAQTAYELADSTRYQTPADYEAWLARLHVYPSYVDRTIEAMREGIRTGRVHPRVISQRLPAQISRQLTSDPRASAFYKPFLEFPSSIADADRDRLRGQAEAVVRDKVGPALEKLRRFVESEYLPAGSERVGVWQFPDGKNVYAFRASMYTTTNLTPEEIHRLGLKEVARIRTQMQSILDQLHFRGGFTEFLEKLRTDPRFYYKSSDELLEAYRSLSKRVDPALVRLFGKLPRMPYGVEPVPRSLAPDTTTAYYLWPAADGSRAGTYYVNLFRPETRPKYEMEALTLHEAVPGHHLQIALAMELENVPNFRRHSLVTAYVEGWGLYAESLGTELGLYQDPYSKFGALTYEIWRAVRLVVDTGMHSSGWSREQAIDYFKANAAKSELDIVNEIDRYIAWPGQALAYKVGELKIRELRRRAEQRLGARFDVRAFHDQLLSQGAMPLDLLEKQMDDWLADQAAKPQPPRAN